MLEMKSMRTICSAGKVYQVMNERVIERCGNMRSEYEKA